jgi:2-oxoglutarate ferredoxin oxidoreductase subunit beta
MNQTSYRTAIIPTWCPGCNNYLVLAGLERAFTDLKLPSSDIAVCYDIGCAGNMADFVKTYGVHTLHGRSIPVAMGLKIANPKLTVIVIGGDGGIYGEGLNHLVSAARMDIDITVLVSNNYLYSLTTGQTSPTTPKGAKTKSTPLGTPNIPVDGVQLVKSVNSEVFAKSVDSKNPVTVISTVKEAIDHRGFSLLDISQFCLAFGKQLNS